MEKQMEQYCRKVKSFLQCSPADARRCIADVQRTAKRLRQEEPGISMDEIMGFLGEPEEVARMFRDTLDPARVERYRRRKKLIFGALIGVLLVGFLGAMYTAYNMAVNPPCTYSETIYITEYDIPDGER